MGATNDQRKAIANAMFGSSTPSNWWLGLSTTAPDEDGNGFTSPSGGAYARVTVANNTTNFPAAFNNSGLIVKQNGTKLTFPNPTGTWGLISYYGWFSASTGGFPVWYAPLDTPITPKAGNTPVEFDVGQLQMIFA